MNTVDRIPDKRKYIIENFGKAMQEGWIEVYYQPIIRGSSGRVCGEEALVRWDDPVFGIMNPIEFIPILEAVNLIDRLDLYVLEQVIAKLEKFEEIGLYRVVHSINFSQIDFYSSDIVSEVKQRVEVSSIPPSLIAIDVIESICGTKDANILSKLKEFHESGFQVWMDNYGNGDFAPILLQQTHFDLLKINMGLVSQLRVSKEARVITTELVRMAMGLGIEVAAEGVEGEEEVEFLGEIGCVKLQGFYYCKPLSLTEILKRYENGNQRIGFENPDERDYYTAVGHVNLYDLAFTNKDNEGAVDYFDTLPMAILQVNSEEISLLRCNANYRKFCYANFTKQRGVSTYYFKDSLKSIGSYAMTAVRQCGIDGKRAIIDERTRNGKMVQLLIDKISENPVTGMSAVAVVILSVTDTPDKADDLNYNYIARALAEDYLKLYFVDMEKDEFTEFVSDGKNRDVKVIAHGNKFFDQPEELGYYFIYREDRPRFIDNFTKERIINDLNEYGKYTITYRTLMDGDPKYVNMKAVRVRTDNKHIIIGISDVDAQTREQEAFERIKEERITFNRITALSSDFLSIYTVDPNTGFYEQFKTSEPYQKYELDPEGKDFFKEARENVKDIIYKDDLEGFMSVFTKEHIMEVIKQRRLFSYIYRLVLEDKPTYVALKAAVVEELDGPQLIIGLVNVDEQIRREKEYAEKVTEAVDMAIRDALTGVKNKHAYAVAEEEFNVRIEEGIASEFAVVVCDLNGLKDINDNYGHQTGDEFIKAGCKIICDVFAHSPVYRIGGDEFVAIAQGTDYGSLDSLLEKMEKINSRNAKKKEVTIAVGVSRYVGQKEMREIFDEADAKMYINKKRMKNGEARHY
ncbi:EAL domain-containing protein [Pseudobutyrivibrio xylanivorans]|uniref:GGDEF domain-containing protein n=1 Tax=Pseudobutyrivibrio xylanivorans TaxID=185007 RepID=A0A5P6VTP2_PSEXY|nr:GGDEF domain-containing protein [Pseudobutyrivibrio xylanivorans]QFJ54574.1 GGDEF domain-containing protein [Pseudobutyrivibrio xylanivorans]